MRFFVPRVLRCYLIGLLATFAGAWLMDATGSMWPLAVGGATSLMCTVPVVSVLVQAMRWPRS